jgi:O-antigen/teichoic acid export membrane protein
VALGQVLSLFAGLASLKVWVTYLSPAELGATGLLLGAISILNGVVLGPITQAVFLSFAQHERNGTAGDLRFVSGAILRNRVAIVVMMIGAVGLPAAEMLGLHWYTVLAMLGLFAVDAWRYFQETLLAAARRQKNVVAISVGDVWLRLLFVWLCLHAFEQTSTAVLMGSLVGGGCLLCAVQLSLRNERHSSRAGICEETRYKTKNRILDLARPLLPSAILSNLTEMGNRFLIGATIGLGPSGIFVVSYGLVKRPFGMLNHIASMTMTPVLANALARNEQAEIKIIRWVWLSSMVGVSMVGAGLFYAFDGLIVKYLLSEGYSAAGELLFGIAVAVALFNVSNVFIGFIGTLGETRAILIVNFAGCLATLSFTFMLCPIFGVAGAVWGLLAGYLVQSFVAIVAFVILNGRVNFGAS